MYINTAVFGQHTVKGIVIGQEEYALPGVAIIEKGTKNGTVTNMEGVFVLTVSDRNSTLVFSYVGYRAKEIQLKGLDEVNISLREDVTKCFFDGNDLGLYLKSGLINTSIGGQVKISIPTFFFSQTIIVGRIGYQTNLKNNEYLDAGVGLEHLVVASDYDIDLNYDYRKINWNASSNFEGYLLESRLNYDRPIIFERTTSLFLGYGKSDLYHQENEQYKSNSGYRLGLGKYIGGALGVEVIGKATYWENFWEYQGEVKKEFKYLRVGAQYLNIDTFTEVSLVFGVNFNYF